MVIECNGIDTGFWMIFPFKTLHFCRELLPFLDGTWGIKLTEFVALAWFPALKLLGAELGLEKPWQFLLRLGIL